MRPLLRHPLLRVVASNGITFSLKIIRSSTCHEKSVKIYLISGEAILDTLLANPSVRETYRTKACQSMAHHNFGIMLRVHFIFSFFSTPFSAGWYVVL